MKVVAVTVTYRGGDRPAALAASLRRAAARVADERFRLRAIAVDNASGDDTVERLRDAEPWVEIVELPQNVGFAAGCNAGLALAGEADLVVLINPDVAVREDFFATLIALDWPPDLAARGPLVLTPEGEVEQSARGFPALETAFFGRTSLLSRLFPSSETTRRELRADPRAGTARVDWVSGATLIAPRDRFDRVGTLDPGYFMYWEDADWCRRATDAGLAVEYEPSLVVEHHQGSSSRSRGAATTIAFHRSAYRYWKLHVARGRVSLAGAAGALACRCLVKLAVMAIRRSASRVTGSGARRAPRTS